MEVTNTSMKGWRQANDTNSLADVHSSVNVPVGGGFFKTLRAYAGPGLMVAVGYMDPGNWATDIAGGARYGYRLLSVVLISNLFAILLQHLSLKLGIATGREALATSLVEAHLKQSYDRICEVYQTEATEP